MIERIVLKINSYKQKYLKQFESFFNISSKTTHSMFQVSRKRIELEKIKIKLKKRYFELGMYVAKQYIKKGYSDFTLDDEFISLNESVKKKIIEYRQIKDSADI